MKRFISSFLLSFSLFFSTANLVSAQSLCPPGQFANLCNLRIERNNNIVGGIITTLFIIAIISSIIFLIWGGIKWIQSGGDKGKIDQARGTITAAIVGLILAFLSYFLVNLVSIIVTGNTFTTLTIPRLID